jgi:hypothetical protein
VNVPVSLIIYSVIISHMFRMETPLLLQPNPYVRLHDIIIEAFPLREKKKKGED